MANRLDGRPWILDTPSATAVKRGFTLTTGFVFRNYSGGIASQAVIKDGRRNVIVATLNGNADGSPVGEAWIQYQPIDDLTLSALDSGQVEVIVK